MRDILVNLLKMISDSGNAIISKSITYFGVSAGIGVGTVQAIAKTTENKLVQECAQATPEWFMYVPIVAAASLVLKNVSDYHFKRKEFKLKYPNH